MTFNSPAWLLTLIPWGVLVVWALRTRGRSVRVPYVALWRDGPSADRRSASPRIRPPSVALASFLAALLFAILAAAGPVIGTPSAASGVTILVDTGVTMSARVAPASGTSVMDDVRDAVLAELPSETAVPLLVETVPAWPQEGESGGWRAHLVRARPVGVDTRQKFPHSVRAARARPDNSAHLVVALTDRRPIDGGERVAWIGPSTAMTENVGIVGLGARDIPVASVLVRIRASAGAARQVAVEVGSGSLKSRRTIALQASGEPREGSAVLEFSKLEDIVRARIVSDGPPAPDAIAADDFAWLVRAVSGPVRIDVEAGLSPELSRLIEVYGRHRQPRLGAEPGRIRIVASANGLSSGERGIIIAQIAVDGPPTTSQTPAASGGGVLVAADHPIMKYVGWEQLRLTDARVTPMEPTAGEWQTLLSIDGRAVLAARASPARQVWVGFDSQEFARRPEFVILWANVLDWLAEHAADTAEPREWHDASRMTATWVTAGGICPTEVPSDWQRDDQLSEAAFAGLLRAPGIYLDAEGNRHAVNIGAVDLPAGQPLAERRAAITRLRATLDRSFGLRVPLLLLSLAMIAMCVGRLPTGSEKRILGVAVRHETLA